MKVWYAPGGRNSNGIPKFRLVRRPKDPPGLQNLRIAAENLEHRYNLIDFLHAWLLSRGQVIPDHGSWRVSPTRALPDDVRAEIQSLQELYEAHASLEQQLLLRVQAHPNEHDLARTLARLRTPGPSRNGFEQPQLLLRLQHNGSHTTSGPDIGFLSPGFWKATTCGDLLGPNSSFAQDLKSHCGGEIDPSRPSTFISLTRASWLVERGMSYNEADNASVAFIDVQTLDLLDVRLDRSDILAHQCKVSRWSRTNPDGIRYTSGIHWLAYGWVPPQSVVLIVPLGSFLEAYYARKVGQVFEVDSGDILRELLHDAPGIV